MDDSTATATPSEERLLDAEEIEQVAKTLQRPTARMQLESLAKKLRKEAAGLKALEAVETSAPSTTTTSNDETKETTETTPSPAPAATTAKIPATPATGPPASLGQKYTTIDRFAFDAGGSNDKFVTLYISLPGVGDEVPKDQISCDFAKASFDLIIRGYKGKAYRLFKDNLEKDIDPEKSKFIVKADKIVVKLMKIKGEYGSFDYWSKLTDPKRNDKKSASKNSSNPAASINELMRDMYESGDDNMRKMIGETMMKQRNGELGNDAMGGMGDMMGGMGM